MAGPVCGANLLTREGTCSKPAGWRTEHPGIGRCYRHGGASPTHNSAALKTKASQLALTYGKPREITPGEAVLEEIRFSAGHVAWLREIVGQLAVGELVWGDAEKVIREGGNDAALEITQRAGPSVWLTLYASERKAYQDWCRIGLQAGVDERLLRLEELKAGAYVKAIDMILDRLELTSEQRALAAAEVPRVLVLVAEQAEQNADLERRAVE